MIRILYLRHQIYVLFSSDFRPARDFNDVPVRVNISCQLSEAIPLPESQISIRLKFNRQTLKPEFPLGHRGSCWSGLE